MWASPNINLNEGIIHIMNSDYYALDCIVTFGVGVFTLVFI